MQYKITEIRDSSLVVEFADGSWAEVPIANGMDAEDIDDAVMQFAPKGAIVDEQIRGLIGQTRVAQKKVIPEPEQPEDSDWEDSWGVDGAVAAQEALVNDIVEKVIERLNSK